MDNDLNTFGQNENFADTFFFNVFRPSYSLFSFLSYSSIYLNELVIKNSSACLS